VTFTVKPVAVDTGVENCAVGIAFADSAMVSFRDVPAIVVAISTVTEAVGATPVTVRGRVEPEALPTLTLPEPPTIVAL
jgi:hypothetical protein